jgi:hypothetical protein
MKKFVQLSLGLLLTEAIKQSDIDLGDASGEINEELMPVKDVDQTPLESIATLNSITSNKDQDTQSLVENWAKETHKIEAAHKIWKNLSEHMVNYVPKFMFTLKDTKDGELHHYEVNETKTKNKYSIKQIPVDNDVDNIREFLTHVDARTDRDLRKQKGGKRRPRYDDDDDSSSSSSSNNIHIKRTSPISTFHYSTNVYWRPNLRQTPSGATFTTPYVTGINIPVFAAPLAPHIIIY